MKNMKDGPAKKQVQKRAMQILKQKKMCAARPAGQPAVHRSRVMAAADTESEARRCGSAHSSRARRRGRYEAQRDRTQQQQFNMDQIGFTKDTLVDTKDTVNAMKAGLKDMKKEFKKMDLGKIEDLQATSPPTPPPPAVRTQPNPPTPTPHQPATTTTAAGAPRRLLRRSLAAPTPPPLPPVGRHGGHDGAGRGDTIDSRPQLRTGRRGRRRPRGDGSWRRGGGHPTACVRAQGAFSL